MESLNTNSFDVINVWLDGDIPAPGKVITDAGLVYTEDNIFDDVIKLLTRNNIPTEKYDIVFIISFAFDEYLKQTKEFAHIPDESLRTQMLNCLKEGMQKVLKGELIPKEFFKEFFRKSAAFLAYDLISFTNIDPNGEVSIVDSDVIKKFKGYVDEQFTKTEDDGNVLTPKQLNVYGYLFKFIEHWVIPMANGEQVCQKLD